MGLDMNLYKVKRESVAYWRKANAIHKWFEDHCADGEIENCADYPVSEEQLIELRDLCTKIVNQSKLVDGKVKKGERLIDGKWEPIYVNGKTIENPELAEELLPTESGFFFGQTDYNEYYIETLKNTIEQIDEILETTDFDKEEIVYSAWW